MLRDHSKKSRNRSIDIYIRAFDDISVYKIRFLEIRFSVYKNQTME